MDRERLRKAIVAAMERSPASIRALARAAGVAHVTLIQVRDGDVQASRGVGERVATALEGWSDDLTTMAGEVREALEAEDPGDGGE